MLKGNRTKLDKSHDQLLDTYVKIGTSFDKKEKEVYERRKAKIEEEVKSLTDLINKLNKELSERSMLGRP